jgi:lipopolysaccharide/colanic/teichoic acid biosynthesis glycosyltransferase
VYLLVPEEARPQVEAAGEKFGSADLIFYGHNCRFRCPRVGKRARVWLINGEQMPMVDWTSALASTRRLSSDVVLFGTATTSGTDCYSEAVLVSDGGEVVAFSRHYDDSTQFADLSADAPTFLVTSGAFAASVVSHLLVRGWGLESVGAMTRRFFVAWAKRPCLFLEPDGAAVACPSRVGRMCAADPTDESTFDRGGWAPAQTIGTHNGAPEHRPAPAAAGTTLSSGAFSPGLRHGDGSTSSSVAPAGGRWYLCAKRCLDAGAAAIGLILLSPILLIVAVLVKVTSAGPVFFGHRRQGLGGREFNCLKFRSMRADADALQAMLREQNEVDGPQFKIANDPRLSPIGYFLRESNLDELPQLINVLLGQMSLVGPRPSPDDENQFCPSWRRTRLSVKPGITGLWQVLRSRKFPETDFQQWIYYDVAYARHRSFWLDLQILAFTPLSMISSKYVKRLAARLERRRICSPVTALTTANVFHE